MVAVPVWRLSKYVARIKWESENFAFLEQATKLLFFTRYNFQNTPVSNHRNSTITDSNHKIITLVAKAQKSVSFSAFLGFIRGRGR